MALHTAESIKALIGKEINLSDWIEISQEMIDRFADLTEDHQYIHVNPEEAAKTPFGGTVAHGFLLLSMLTKLAVKADFRMENVYMGVNYGFERIRFISPVRAGKRIRGRFVLKDMVERSPGQWMSTLGVTVEIEGEAKAAVTVDWLGLQFVRDA